DDLGHGSMLEGVLSGIESGWFEGEIADAAYVLERKVNTGAHLVVGVNTALDGNDEPPPEILRIGPEGEEAQCKRLARVRADRDEERVRACLDAVRTAAEEPTANVMPSL